MTHLRRHPTERTVEMIASFEGGESPDGLFHPYRDPVGVWTIGYGHTEGVNAKSKPLTKAEAVSLLRRDLVEHYGPHINNLNLPLTQPQYDATLSFVYNLGAGVLAASTDFGRELRAHHWHAAADAMLEYDRAGGNVLPGLKARRERERNLFLEGTH